MSEHALKYHHNQSAKQEVCEKITHIAQVDLSFASPGELAGQLV